MPGDSIVVKQITSTVNVSGHVYNPGLIEYRNGRKINYLLQMNMLFQKQLEVSYIEFNLKLLQML